MNAKRFVLGLTVLLCVWSVLCGAKWEPFNFKGNERYEYKIVWKEGGTERNAVYVMDVKRREDGKFDVTYTTKGVLTGDELAEGAFGLWSVYGVSLSVLVLNPAYSFFFSQMELKPGEKMNFFGAGIVEVTGKEKIGGREGYVCKLSAQEGLLAEWVIDPDLALPIRSITYEDGEPQGIFELVKYTKY